VLAALFAKAVSKTEWASWCGVSFGLRPSLTPHAFRRPRQDKIALKLGLPSENLSASATRDV
jgi:hypothetical protein